MNHSYVVDRSNADDFSVPSVLVTGAGKRLGREIALHLAKHGWRVAVHCRSSEQDAQETARLCNQFTKGAMCFSADLHDENSARQLIDQVLVQFGHLNALINNASLFEHDDASNFTFAKLEQHLRINTASPIVLAFALYQHIKERNQNKNDSYKPTSIKGVVVNLLDQKLWNQNPDFLSYTLSKAALEAAGTMLSHALAPEVRVVGVAPGLTLTSDFLSDEEFQAMHRLSPLNRSSTPENIAHAVRFALENDAITGTTLLVDGGQHLMHFERDFSLMKSSSK